MGGGFETTLFKVLRGTSDASIRFEDLRSLLHGLGFSERVRSSHHIFSGEGVSDIPEHRLARHGRD